MDFQSTYLPIETQYPKLVRDNIPSIIKARTAKEPEVKVAVDDEEYAKYLLAKIIEEAYELQYSEQNGNMKEELADVFEVIYAILKLKGWTIEDIIAVQKEKREKNGGFEKRFILTSDSHNK